MLSQDPLPAADEYSTMGHPLHLAPEEIRAEAYANMPLEQLVEDDFISRERDEVRQMVILQRFPAYAPLVKRVPVEETSGSGCINPQEIMPKPEFLDSSLWDGRGFYGATPLRELCPEAFKCESEDEEADSEKGSSSPRKRQRVAEKATRGSSNVKKAAASTKATKPYSRTKVAQ